MTDHLAYLREGKEEVMKRNANRKEEALVETLAGAPVQVARRLRRATKTRECMRVHPSTVNGTELGAQEWQDNLFL